MDLEVSHVDEAAPDFWPIIGPIVTSPVLLKLRKGKGLVHEKGASFWHVARQNGRVVGFAVMRVRPVMEPFIRLDELHVDQVLRAGRIPRLLMEAQLGVAAQKWPGIPAKVFGDDYADIAEAVGFTRAVDAKGKNPVWTLAAEAVAAFRPATEAADPAVGEEPSGAPLPECAAAPPALRREAERLAGEIACLAMPERVQALNAVRWVIHTIASPFEAEPVDFVAWVPAAAVAANDYNPNRVASQEMDALTRSIERYGYTQPIVTAPDDRIATVVDGFHRHRVGKESPAVRERVRGHLPVTYVGQERQGRADRVEATIAHNRARGKHTVDGMAAVVQDLLRQNLTADEIGIRLGMTDEEVIRLMQITGIARMFAADTYGMAWGERGDSLLDPDGRAKEPAVTELGEVEGDG